MLALRSIFFALVLPGMMTVAIPRWLVSSSDSRVADSSVLRIAGVTLIAIGAAVMIWCIWDFARKGRGTLAPVDPPTQLVVQGLYRYVRNPMYLGALLTITGQTILFMSPVLLWYLIGWFTGVHLFVVFYEEPTLRRRFGVQYDNYCAGVRRWRPSLWHSDCQSCTLR
jgi:protein-S-isoprenylcysteine O-methyltransferase Ste14